MSDTNIEIITKELHKAFKLVNKHYFESKIPLPAITIQSSGKRSLSMGWCNVSFLETMDTLMHEMAHLYNKVHNVKDVSRNGTYHNKRFLERALKSGFHFPDGKPHQVYGYSNIRLTDETKKFLENSELNKEVFSIARKTPTQILEIEYENNNNTDTNSSNEEKPKKPKTSYKWTCPSCDLIIRSSKKEINVICGNCNETLICEE